MSSELLVPGKLVDSMHMVEQKDLILKPQSLLWKKRQGDVSGRGNKPRNEKGYDLSRRKKQNERGNCKNGLKARREG